MARISSGARRPSHEGLITAISGLALAVMVIALVGVWHLRTRRSAPAAREHAVAIMIAPVTQSLTAAVGNRPPVPTTFVIDTPEAEAYLWAFIQPLEQMRLEHGLQPTQTRVLVVPASARCRAAGLAQLVLPTRALWTYGRR